MKQLWAYLWGIGLCVGGVASAQLPQIDNYSGDANAFAHEWQTQFMNTGFGPNPVLFNTDPVFDAGRRLHRAAHGVGAVQL